MSELSERLRFAREQAGLSQAQVAKMMGVHRPTISEIEAGRRRVTAEEMVEFARIYDVSISWLSGSDKDDGVDDDRVRFASRELAKLNPADLESIMRLLATMRKSKASKR
jgi:transcriptional regulator with XRE-family HTH domain